MGQDVKKNDGEKPLSHLDNYINELKTQVASAGSSNLTGTPLFNQKSRRVDEKLRKLKIANDIIENDQELKKQTLRKLFRFLALETIVIFILAFLQGFKWWGFELDEWSFRLVIAATIGQITTMLVIAVQHLFPHRKV